MNPYVSWAIVLVVTGGLGFYYSNTTKPRGRTPVRAAPEKVEAAAPAPKHKKPKARKSPEPSSKQDEKPASPPPVYTADDEDDANNKEFAKRLAAARTGVTVGDTKTKPRKEIRSKVVAAAPESVGSELSTRAPSSNGGDADDDLSSTDNVVASADDVSDMLEKPAPGASVLRLTGSVESKEKKQKPQAFKPVETKKQRQNRQKNEARKQANQEAEAERRKLREKQLHTAREHERQEAARQKPAAAPQNAWNKTNGAVATPAPATTANENLLDTFEPVAKPSGSSGTWTNNLPPEEEQMRILGVSPGEEDWTTVPSKKEKTKKKAKADESANEASSFEAPATISESKPTEWVAPVAPAPVPVPVPRGKNHPLDSDWAA
ncbi:hypothetical protein BGW36DRAFT_427396 [Talaromyces proteolyticus]|uniref:Uncharacterized protein n=1 Tax=Talaromyces proteolyticus TaxID=1131652 RepID=A0AAD4KUS7_9EURO|nr:uncharacterized protein BGW36DRAFT_427396 [Talaromyces proteolyticus]KAH8697435.1 hypothetical protein BGW36DRAFT_427396 [Talaromyces proteolyticus]